MSEDQNQDIVDQETPSATEAVETAPEAQEENDRETLSLNKSDNSAEKPVDYDKAFAGVKKEAREKGYKQGYDEAVKKIESAMTPETSNFSQSVEQQPFIDPNKPLTAAEFESMQYRKDADLVTSKGNSKYSDFEDKMKNLVPRLTYNPQLRALVKKAVETGNEDLIYNISSDATLRGNLLDMNPSEWGSAFFKKPPEDEVKKNPAPPLDVLKVTPATGTKDSRQRRIESLRRNNSLRFSS